MSRLLIMVAVAPRLLAAERQSRTTLGMTTGHSRSSQLQRDPIHLRLRHGKRQSATPSLMDAGQLW
jgi:hypothetical protein